MGVTIFKYVFLIAILVLCGYLCFNLVVSIVKNVKSRKEKKKSEINKGEDTKL